MCACVSSVLLTVAWKTIKCLEESKTALISGKAQYITGKAKLNKADSSSKWQLFSLSQSKATFIRSSL